MAIDWAEKSAAYKRDGVVHVPGLLNAAQLDATLKAYEWSLANPTAQGTAAKKFQGANGGPLFYADSYHPDVLDGYRSMLESSPIADACAKLWGSEPVWFIYEQVFLKEGGETRRTPWHQDGSYLPLDGEDVAVAWITFDRLTKEDSLEFIPGSHRGTVYNTSKFDPRDDTIPNVPSEIWPNLPPIEKEREKYEIVSWATEPGDVIFFHFRTLHGGAPTRGAQRRRTLTLRFFGENAHYDPKLTKALPNVPDMQKIMTAGQTFRDPRFLQVHPR